MELTDEQWALVSPILPSVGPRGRRGRPVSDLRFVLNGILFRLSRRCSWNAIPVCFGGWQTCFAYYERWRKAGIIDQVIVALLRDLRRRGGFDYRLAVTSGDVHFCRVGEHYRVFYSAIPTRSSPPEAWMLSTGLLFFQYFAWYLETKEHLASSTDPFSDLHFFDFPPRKNLP